MLLGVLSALGIVGVLALISALDGGDGGDSGGSDPGEWAAAQAAETDDGRLALLVGSSPEAAANTAAETLVDIAPVAVVAESGDEAARAEAAELATTLRAPLLISGASDTGGLDATLDELEVRTVVAVGQTGLTGDRHDLVDPDADDDADRLSALVDRAAEAPEPEGGAVLVRPDDEAAELAAPTLSALGHEAVVLTAADPRADGEVMSRLAELDRPVVAGVGTEDAWADASEADLRWQVAVAEEGMQLPGGGQIMYPLRVMVALYGTPETGVLGVLGEQDLAGSIQRAKDLAAAYEPVSDVPVVPAFELIVSVATGGPGFWGDYSRRVPVEIVREWVAAAGEAGVYVVLDLQPGRTDFLIQAKEWEEFLAQPHVGLALDAEWRLGPNQVPNQQIGSVSIEEVNSVVTWLAGVTRRHHLPQKLLLLHQFNLDMIRDRAQLDTSRSELAVAIQMDGNGTPGAKLETWTQLRTVDPPAGVWWGWKNFYDEDPIVLSPEQVLALRPIPVWVSYQ